MFFFLISQIYGSIENIINQPINITLQSGSDEKHLAIYLNREFRFITKEEALQNYEYNDLAKIKKKGDNHIIYFDKLSLCIDRNNSKPVICKKNRIGELFQILEIDGCKMIYNDKKCLTRIEKPKADYDVAMFDKCEKNENQCFNFKFAHISDERDKEDETVKPRKRVEKKSNEYDLNYVNENVDEGQHTLAKLIPELPISKKRYVPRCFDGYPNMAMYLNDPLPNLRRIRNKYCIEVMRTDRWN